MREVGDGEARDGCVSGEFSSGVRWASRSGAAFAMRALCYSMIIFSLNRSALAAWSLWFVRGLGTGHKDC